MADGHLNKCKECAKTDVHDHRHGKGRAKVLAYDTARSKTQARMQHNRATTKEWREAHPRERAAQLKLAAAVRSGKVFKWPACAMPECASTKPVAHHADYDRPLDVVWLCQAHHKQAHAIVDN